MTERGHNIRANARSFANVGIEASIRARPTEATRGVHSLGPSLLSGAPVLDLITHLPQLREIWQ
jgi:hypothetical protein